MEKQLQHQRATDERSAVFLISPFKEDHIFVARIFDGVTWRVSGVSSCAEALEILPAWRSAVVICDSELPDGDWKEILEALVLLPCPPPMVVTSRLADERLWGEVLHLGGYDVLAKPLDKREVLWAVNSAWQQCYRRMEPITRAKQAAAATMQ
ncbi:MAG: response regulator [Bryobacterales bacterium]|nr:response regulator [Bryobacterales bacterium]